MPQHATRYISTDLPEPAALKREQYSNLAKELHQAEKRREPIDQFSRRFPDMTFVDSYAIQREWIALKLAEGRRVIGHKIGLTSRAMQSASGIDEPGDPHPLVSLKGFRRQLGQLQVGAEERLQIERQKH